MKSPFDTPVFPPHGAECWCVECKPLPDGWAEMAVPCEGSIVLSSEQWARLMDLIENPPAPPPALIALLRGDGADE